MDGIAIYMAHVYTRGMKTTLNINDAVMRELKREAAKRGCTMGVLVESALRLFLKASKKPPAELPPLPTFNGGRELVDFSNREAMYDALEDADDRRLQGWSKPTAK